MIERFAEWGIEHAGLFTWSHSPKHTYLYQKFGFWARFLNAIMSKSVVERLMAGADEPEPRWSRFSGLSEGDRERTLKACGDVTGAVYDGPDVSGEIRAVARTSATPCCSKTTPGSPVRGLPPRSGDRGRQRRVLRQVRGDPAVAGRGA